MKTSPELQQSAATALLLAPAEEVSARLRQRVEELHAQELQHLSNKDGKHAGGGGQQTDKTSAASAALMSSWMRRTGWDDLFKDAHRDVLITLLTPPYTHSSSLRPAIHNGRTLVSPAADEDKLRLMMAALDRLIDRCCDTIRHTDVSMRRWLRGRFADRPFKAPFELVSRPESERKYRRLIKRFLCFWLRLWRLPRQTSNALACRTPSKAQRHMLQSIWCDPVWDSCLEALEAAATEKSEGEDDEEGLEYDNDDDDDDDASTSDGDSSSSYSSGDYGYSAEEENFNTELESDVEAERDVIEDGDITEGQQLLNKPPVAEDPAADALLRFLYYRATEEFTDGQSRSTMLVYFSAICGLSHPDGANFLRPAQFTTHLSGFIYCIRLILIEAILPRKAHEYVGIPARPRMGQLAILQSLRQEKMCDGCLSLLGEFLSLSAFGHALRQSEIPAFVFEWSDDGEEISCDGDQRLTMTAFRGLAQSVLQTAAQMSKRLMYNWEPPTPNFKNIRDRLSNPAAGYSFIIDPIK